MGAFSVAAYNNIPDVPDAASRLDQQLASAHITRCQLFEELTPLFLEEEKAGRRYAACLVHRHYHLNDGERMVTNGNRSTPSRDITPSIVPQSWFSTGEEYEYRVIDNNTFLPPPPSPDFLQKFKNVIDKHGIDILGVSYAPDELAPGFMFSENTGHADREQVVSIVLESSLDFKTSYQAVWTVRLNSEGGRCVMLMLCTSCCHGCKPIRPKPPCESPKSLDLNA